MPLAFGAFAVCLVVCELVRRFALRRALLDAPNARSLHATAVPRLGGVGIFLTTASLGFAETPLTDAPRLVSLGAACVLALVGLRDDVKPLSSGLRFALQILVGAVFLGCVGVPSLLLLPGLTVPLPSAAIAVLLVVWFVAVLNIYNFMDGMDGLAGSQATLGAFALAVVQGDASTVLVVLGAAALGFLAHNAPPARMFLGDAGSYFLGTIFASTVINGLHAGISVGESSLAIAPFLLDGTFTILRRASRGEKIWQAHRSHLYQRAVQTGLSHRDVLLVYLLWIGTCAGCAAAARHRPMAIVGGWLVALLGLAIIWRWVNTRESERADTA